MKAFFLLALIAAVSAVRIEDARVPAFIEGFAMGLTIDIKNMTECASHAQMTILPFEKALPVVKDALAKDSVSELKYTLPLLGVGIQEVARALKACRSSLYASVNEVGAEFQFPEKSADVLSKILLPSSQENLDAMATAFMSKDYFTAGVYGGRAVSVFLGYDSQTALRARRTY